MNGHHPYCIQVKSNETTRPSRHLVYRLMRIREPTKPGSDELQAGEAKCGEISGRIAFLGLRGEAMDCWSLVSLPVVALVCSTASAFTTAPALRIQPSPLLSPELPENLPVPALWVTVPDIFPIPIITRLRSHRASTANPSESARSVGLRDDFAPFPARLSVRVGPVHKPSCNPSDSGRWATQRNLLSREPERNGPALFAINERSNAISRRAPGLGAPTACATSMSASPASASANASPCPRRRLAVVHRDG